MIEHRFFLYRHIRIDKNEPFYIGIGRKRLVYNSFTSMKSEYRRAYSKDNRSKFWKRIISKTEYKVEIIIESDNFEFIKKKEIEFIQLYGRRDIHTGVLCNLTDGGEGMLNINRNIIQNLNRKGCKATQETKDKISKANTGRIITWGDKISVANTGRILSEITKEKVRVYQNNNKHFGKDNKSSKRVTQIDRKTNKIIKIWDCAHDVKKNLITSHYAVKERSIIVMDIDGNIQI